MADFDNAFEITMGHEGGYVHDPDDPGGETYRGISRRFYPSWAGWETIDALKDKPNFRQKLKTSKTLQKQVPAFYKQTFWDIFWGDEIPDQGVAEELFDTGVNMGVGRAVKFMQKGLNALNRNQKNYDDIGEDGGMGPNTLGALNAYLTTDPPDHLLKIMNILQGMHYITRMRESPTQEKYARGWLKRVLIQKT